MSDLTLKSRRVLLPQGLKPATVRVSRGRIAELLPHAASADLDLGDDVLMPSLVDCHVHINEPGRAEWEGFVTATRAAAAGGITTLVDMPLNSDPVTTSVAAFDEKLAAAQGKLHVDVGFWGGVVPGNLAELEPMARSGVLGFKCFLIHSGLDAFPHVGEAELRPAMKTLRRLGLPLLVHAELELPVRNALQDASPREYLRYLHSRPREWEDAAIAMMIRLCRETRCRVHIVHLSSSNALPMLRAAKAEGLPITVETCPHYLCLKAEEVPAGATEFKCAPPIREDENRERLWAGLAEGVIDFVISDHSPCIPGLKLLEQGDFMEAWGGIASLQLGLANVWTEAARRGFDVSDMYHWMCRAPLNFLGLGWGRGSIAMGARADLVAWAPEERFEIAERDIKHRHVLTPYLGRTVLGPVTGTWLGGRRIVEGGEVLGPPRGRPLLHASGAATDPMHE
ncbi:MAG: allantoinase AllB [Alphaproteobacteria bacterium]|nr:allantoinase AllB [Alphaproteobacteria bacterium]